MNRPNLCPSSIASSRGSRDNFNYLQSKYANKIWIRCVPYFTSACVSLFHPPILCVCVLDLLISMKKRFDLFAHTQYERDIERAQARVKYANTNFVKRILGCVLVKEYTSRARDIRNPYTLTKPLSRCSSMLY